MDYEYKFKRSDKKIDELTKLINPSIKSRTTWDKCFETIMEYINGELSIELILKPSAITILSFKCPTKSFNAEISNDLSWEDGDFNYNYIYKLIINRILKEKLIKKSKIKKDGRITNNRNSYKKHRRI